MPNEPSSETVAAQSAKPFLKWAGGKTQLLSHIRSRFPEPLRSGAAVWPHHYFEPFMGSAAVFFHLSPSLLANKTHLSDTNPELILTFLAVRDHLDALLERLKTHDVKHNHKYKNSLEAQRAYYESVRAQDRRKSWSNRIFGEPVQNDPATLVEHAARFIYLNKTCFNGLWRVNAKGQHNVPMGRYKNPAICNEDLLHAAHAALQGVGLECQSYERTIASARPHDVVYFDPPYMPVSSTSSFNAYAKEAFLELRHRELAVVFLGLASRGVHVVLSNADTPFTREPLGNREDFANFTSVVAPIVAGLGGEVSLEDLFASYRTFWNVATVAAKRAINSKADKRGTVTEILVSTCRNPDHV